MITVNISPNAETGNQYAQLLVGYQNNADRLLHFLIAADKAQAQRRILF